MKKHFITFLSPGTLVSEQTTKEIKDWNVDLAVSMSKTIVERYGATPYAFYFSTRERKSEDFDSCEIKRSPKYFLGGKIETAEEILARKQENEHVLRANIRNNGIARVWRSTKGWACAIPLDKEDLHLSTE
jgi:hypothetical protein